MSKFERLAAAAALAAAANGCDVAERRERPNVRVTATTADYEVDSVSLFPNGLGRTTCEYSESQDGGTQSGPVAYQCEKEMSGMPSNVGVRIRDRGIGPVDCGQISVRLSTRNGRNWTERQTQYVNGTGYGSSAECIYRVVPTPTVTETAEAVTPSIVPLKPIR